MGPGGSQQANFSLKASVPAGTYHIECDAVIIKPVDVTFDLVWGHNGTDTVLVEWMQHFDPNPGGNFDAQAYEVDEDAAAINFSSGDTFGFRYTGANTTSQEAFIPNGDGVHAHGRIPSITLP